MPSDPFALLKNEERPTTDVDARTREPFPDESVSNGQILDGDGGASDRRLVVDSPATATCKLRATEER